MTDKPDKAGSGKKVDPSEVKGLATGDQEKIEKLDPHESLQRLRLRDEQDRIAQRKKYGEIMLWVRN